MFLPFVGIFTPSLIALLLHRWTPAVLAGPALGFAIMVAVGWVFKGKDGVLVRVLAMAFYGLLWLLSIKVAIRQIP
jgi:membrane protease YdiL (CAAX protease family)